MDGTSRLENRRTRTDGEAALAAGKWIVVRDDAGQLDPFDADARAILFLYCSHHAMPCERCQETYRLGWPVRSDAAPSCPHCSDDLTQIVVAHALRARTGCTVARAPSRRCGSRATPRRGRPPPASGGAVRSRPRGAGA